MWSSRGLTWIVIQPANLNLNCSYCGYCWSLHHASVLFARSNIYLNRPVCLQFRICSIPALKQFSLEHGYLHSSQYMRTNCFVPYCFQSWLEHEHDWNFSVRSCDLLQMLDSGVMSTSSLQDGKPWNGKRNMFERCDDQQAVRTFP